MLESGELLGDRQSISNFKVFKFSSNTEYLSFFAAPLTPDQTNQACLASRRLGQRRGAKCTQVKNDGIHDGKL